MKVNLLKAGASVIRRWVGGGKGVGLEVAHGMVHLVGEERVRGSAASCPCSSDLVKDEANSPREVENCLWSAP